jgi:hypothetical protein
VTKVAVVAGVVLVALCVWAAVGGFGPLGELLLTATVLVLLIAVGNLLMSPPRRETAPDGDHDDP